MKDHRVAFAYNATHDAHAEPGHVERPERLTALLSTLQKDEVWNQVTHIEATSADLDAARLVHTPDYLARLETAMTLGGTRLDPDTYTTGESLRVALQALGCALGVTEAVVTGKARAGFAAIRPPGHHATPSEAMGFCLLSNVAVAARWAQTHHGLDRVLIVDFDVHHGNGTQDAFYADPSVLFMSTHQYPYYPGTGALHDTGSGAGAGMTVNLPLPSGVGDDGYAQVFERILTPLALRFEPDLILLSAGFDAHWKDPLGGMFLSVSGFARLVQEVVAWAEACCGGRIVGVLEGGYATDALAASVLATLRLFTDPASSFDDPLGPARFPERTITPYLKELTTFWGLEPFMG